MSSITSAQSSGSMGNMRQSALTYLVHASVLFLVILWTLPTVGLLISSFRDKDQLAVSGWWTSLSASLISSSNQELLLNSATNVTKSG